MDNFKKFHQHYPTYQYKDRDVVLLEFENAQDLATGQIRILEYTTGLILAIAAVLASLGLRFGEIEKVRIFLEQNYLIVAGILIFLSLIFIFYFAELQKTFTLNARKTIVLREMLGLDYGVLQLVLPRNRIEGATDPFVIKMFPGWRSISSIPFWTVLVLSNTALFFVLSFSSLSWYMILIPYSLVAFLIFRYRLFDVHENYLLSFIKVMARCMNIKLVSDFVYVVYFAELAINELRRLNFRLTNVKEILIVIEDNNFYNHRGIDLKAVFRASLSRFSFFRRRSKYLSSGASTINMQLVRTLFIKEHQKKWRRKILEFFLARWLDKQFSKNHILELYLASVRFEVGVMGISDARKYFFPRNTTKNFSNEEALFLVERISSIHSRVDKVKINNWINRTQKNTAILINNPKLLSIYRRLIKDNILIGEI
ncbi:MAG TPA: biosynthetic peptidoglycan transglycosylase [Patescibacteria group bacterium]|nr:biosynthetic peptidoglycan transglycosylase [Patescibacteria group bacterium]